MKRNIILIGMPGSGKTTIGKGLAEKTGKEFIDFDDDIIEGEVGKTVADILDNLGEQKFLELEEQLALELNLQNAILSTSGSVPLSVKAMDHLRCMGSSILINLPLITIQSRLTEMKIDRIVGMEIMTMEEILEYRDSFYQKAYDYKFDTNGLLGIDKVFEEFMMFYRKNIRQ